MNIIVRMSRVRKYQVMIIILINIVFFLALDYSSRTPIIIDFGNEEPSRFTVTGKLDTPKKFSFMLMYESSEALEGYEFVREQFRDQLYGQYIKYKVEFLGDVLEDRSFMELIKSGESMNVLWTIGGYTKGQLRGFQEYLTEEKELLLVVPGLSIDRHGKNSTNIIGMNLNVTRKAEIFAELMVDSGVSDFLVFDTGYGYPEAVVAQLESLDVKAQIVTDISTNKVVGTPLGVVVSRLNETIASQIREKYPDSTIFCEAEDELNGNIMVFTPKVMLSKKYLQFEESFMNSIGRMPTFEEACIYDACNIIGLAVEESKYRPWNNPESFWKAAKTYDGVTGNCTLNDRGDRATMEYVLVQR